jgi:hypothetical protein
LIEVLLRARDSVSQVTQKVVRSLDDVTKAQKRSTDETARAKAPLREQISVLEQLVESHMRDKKALEDSSKASRENAAAARAKADADRKVVEGLRKRSQLEKAEAREIDNRNRQEIASMRARAAEMDAFSEKRTKAVRAEIAQLRREATAFEALAQEESAANKTRASRLDLQIAQSAQGARESARTATAAEQAAGREERAYNSASKEVDRHGKKLSGLREEFSRTDEASRRSERATGPFTRALQRMGFETGNARTGLKGLNAEFQGFQIALIIKYAQALVSALISLGAQFVAVAAAAGQAAIGIGGALAAGAAQAVPVVGVLIAAFSRLTAVLKIVKLFNQQQLTAAHDATRASKAQATAADQIRSAEQRVADAHRATARAVTDLARTRSDAARQETQAQQDVTKARKDAIRTVQDLMAAEEDAAQQLLQSQQSRQRAIETGDVMGAVQGEIDVTRARRDVGRARQDAAPVRARGVEGVDAVQQAEQRLADTRRQGARQIQQSEQSLGDARRSEVQATQDLSRTRRDAADNLAQETAAADKLTDSLKQLSPAERTLYRRILDLQNTYRRIARPITDIITRAFTGVVERVTSLLRDPRIIRGFRNIATQISASIGAATREAGGRRSIGAFQILSAEATRNIPIVTRILINFFRAARNIVLAGVPAFRLLLRYVEGYSKQAEHASRNSKGIRDFFITGVRYAKSFFDLGLAVVRLLLAIAGRGGAAGEGIRTIRDLTRVVDGLTDKANHNAGAIRRFFRRTHDAFFEILGVLGTLASTLVSTFSPSSVKSFADFLNRIIIPALGDTIKILGVLATAFHQLISLPGVADVARLAATFLLLAKGLTVVRLAVADLMGIIPAFLRAMGLMLTAEEAAAAGVTGLSMLTGVGEIVVIIGAIIAAIVLLDRKFHFLAPTWRWIKHAAVDAFDAIKKAAASVAHWFSDVWTQGLLYWIRYPFVWLAKHAGGPAFRWIINAAGDVIDWLKKHFGHGGDFAIIGDLIAAPFRLARAQIKFVFDVIKTIIGGALDLIAGRFDKFSDRMSDFWSGFIDMGRGAVSSLLGIVGDLLGAFGKIPKLGGPFKDAAKAVRNAQHNIDDLRDSTKKHRQEQKKSDDVVKDALPTLVLLRKRYEVAKDRLDKLTPGTDAYRRAAKRAHETSKDYNEALRDTASKAGGARQPVRKLKDNIQNLGDVSSDTADAVAGDLNSVLKQVGAKEIDIHVRRARHRSNAQNVVGSDNPLLGNPFANRYMGGMASPFGGSPHDDHVLVSPSGRAVAALSGTEGIVNAPQMGIINNALSLTQQMTGMPWGSLNDLWGSGMRHYQRGGKLQLPATFRSTHQTLGLPGYPAVDVMASPGTPVGSPISGRVTKLSGRPPSAGAYAGLGGPFGWTEYISGGGRTYYLTHFGSRSVRLGQRVRRGQVIGTVGDYPGGVPDHIHEGLHGAGMRVTGTDSALGAAMVPRLRVPRMTGLGRDALSRIARASARRLTRAANRYLQNNVSAFPGGSGGDLRGIDFRDIGTGSDAALMRSISRARGWNFSDWWKLDAGESSHGRNLANPTSSARLRGQFLSSNWGRYGPGSDPRRNPSMNQQIRSMAQYISERYHNPTRAYRSWLSRTPHWYTKGGLLGRAGRRMQSGGTLTSTVRGPTMSGLPGGRAVRIPSLLNPAAPILRRINGLFDDVAHQLDTIARGPLNRSKRLVLRIQRALARITGDGGLLDQMGDQTELITARVARNLQRRQFRVTRQGPRRTAVTDAEIAQTNLQGFQAQRTGLRDERGAIQDSIGDAESALAIAHRRHNKKAAAAARAALVDLRTRLDANTTAMAQNAQDQVEAQEQFQDALLAAVNDAADRQNSAIDRWSRMAKALGQNLDPNAVLGAQIQNMQTQIGGLQGVLAEAQRTGNTTLANTIASSIDDLNVQIAEAVAQQFQNSIDAVNNEAQKQTTRLDRATRIAQLGGQTNFAALGNILGQRGGVLTTQRAGLQGLLQQAQARGDIEQVNSLTDQIEELDTAMAENTQAIKDNTDAAFNFNTQQINDAANFGQGIFGGAQGFFQALSEATGINTGPQQLAALQGIATTLATQTSGLQQQLASLTGDNSVLGLSGSDLVNYLVSISSGPAFQAILARLDPTQDEAFKDLVTALLGNATATVQNTQAMQNLANPNAQSFSSTLWSTFRQAVFTGAGGLLPQYATTIPTAAIGAHVMRSGMMLVHAGEDVRPARVTRDWRGGDGDTYHLNVTTPTEVLNPTDVGRQLAFYRRSQGGRG